MAVGGYELLREARELVAFSWTQGTDARATDGTPVWAGSDEATSWSLLGALVACHAHLWRQDESAALRTIADACDLLARVLDTYRFDEWNDARHRTREDVLEAIDGALGLPALLLYTNELLLN